MPKPEPPTERKRRLAEALRQNLKRRKAQGRGRAAAALREPAGDSPRFGKDKTD